MAPNRSVSGLQVLWVHKNTYTQNQYDSVECCAVFFGEFLFIFNTNLVFASTFSSTGRFFFHFSFVWFRSVLFFHHNLIYSFRIACFPINLDVGSLGSWMESHFHLTHYRMFSFVDVISIASVSFSVLSRDNCLFRFAFTWNFNIICYSVSVCWFSLLMIFILA